MEAGPEAPIVSSMGEFRVLIAGGGVAALEGLLALRERAADRVEVTLLAPGEDFVVRQLSVTEPFGLGKSRAFSLSEIALEQGARFHRGALKAIDPEARTAAVDAGDGIEYDALLVATGVRPIEVLPGALTFRGPADTPRLREALAELDGAEAPRVAFALPREASWPLPLYELALLTRARVRESNPSAEVHLVTPEAWPLELFGLRASGIVRRLLSEAGVQVHLKAAPLRFADGSLELASKKPLDFDAVVALPGAEAPEIPGLPQRGPRRFVPVDRYGQADGAGPVFAAGDVTWFPVKQGGLAAQQADSAASAIAALAGADVQPQEFRPVLRGAMLSGSGPRYLRADIDQGSRDGASTIARSVLWWPPTKLAGRLLGPYLAAKAGFPPPSDPHLTDLEAPIGDDAGSATDEHSDAVAMALESADANARWRDFEGALKWLEVAEDLELYLPPRYERKRVEWGELADRSSKVTK
jgi:sulfide:quinone oxidoreductase